MDEGYTAFQYADLQPGTVLAWPASMANARGSLRTGFRPGISSEQLLRFDDIGSFHHGDQQQTRRDIEFHDHLSGLNHRISAGINRQQLARYGYCTPVTQQLFEERNQLGSTTMSQLNCFRYTMVERVFPRAIQQDHRYEAEKRCKN
jgi:hypothetical protein